MFYVFLYLVCCLATFLKNDGYKILLRTSSLHSQEFASEDAASNFLTIWMLHTIYVAPDKLIRFPKEFGVQRNLPSKRLKSEAIYIGNFDFIWTNSLMQKVWYQLNYFRLILDILLQTKITVYHHSQKCDYHQWNIYN